MNMFNSDYYVLLFLQQSKGALINSRDCIECPGRVQV